MALTEVPTPCFVALDFETATRSLDSACAVALVRVECGRICHRERRLIRPPSRRFEFSWLHGISWKDVRDEPTFGEVWADLRPLFDGAAFIAAHNARFDQAVLLACLRSCGIHQRLRGQDVRSSSLLAQIDVQDLPFVCTMKLAGRMWGLKQRALPQVCRHLGLSLRHHDPLSDAEACAEIVIAAETANPAG